MYGAYRNKKANGGLITGPGTGTSDSIQDEVPEGTYILPADTTAAIAPASSGGFGVRGHKEWRARQDAQANQVPSYGNFGAYRNKVPVNVSNGELKVSPDLLQNVGASALDGLLEATHTPVAEQESTAAKPELFFANGGQVVGGVEGYRKGKAIHEARAKAQNFGAYRKNYANGGLVDDPTKPRQTSFDITNTPAAQRAAGIAPANSPAVASPPSSAEPAGLPHAATSTAPSGIGFGARSPAPSGQALTPDRIQAMPGRDGWARTGFGIQRQGGEIAARVGPNGQAEFTNDAGTVASAVPNYGNFGARRPAAAPAAQPRYGAYRRTPEQLAAMHLQNDQDLAATGSAANLGNGVGTFSQAQAGDAQLALDRFERANQQRQQMVDTAHRGELGNNGGQVTVVRDSTRAPSDVDIQNARLNERLANTDATRQQAQNSAALAYQNRDLQTAKLGLDIQNARQTAQLNSRKLDAQQTMDELLSMSSDPSLSQEQRLRARDQYLLRSAPGQYAKQSMAPPKAMPASVQKLEDADLDAAAGAAAMNQNLAQIQQRLGDGTLQLGPVLNRVNATKNFFGASDEESRNYGSMMSTLEKIRNDSLRLNKGVQTEGDAQRAWNELISNANDPQLVAQRIAEIQALNQRALGFRQAMINQRRANFGLEPLDIHAVTGAVDDQLLSSAATSAGSARGAQPPISPASVVRVNSPDDLAKLPSGAIFIGPDGVTRRKQ